MSPLFYTEELLGNAQNANRLLIMMHGYGSHENDLIGLAPLLPQQFKVISLRAPHRLPWGGFAWYSLDFTDNGIRTNVAQALETLDSLEESLPKWAEEKDCNPNEIWLMGFSQGSILSLALALRCPKRLQGVIALSGYLNKDLLPQQMPQNALANTHLFLAHGTQDDVIPIQWARESSKALEQMKIAHHYREYPLGHGINAQVMTDLSEWMKGHL